jgi:hypothetical protein
VTSLAALFSAGLECAEYGHRPLCQLHQRGVAYAPARSRGGAVPGARANRDWLEVGPVVI